MSPQSVALYIRWTIALSFIFAVAAQQRKQCAGYNEYCQSHWDCCSNSCMSYSYRCTRTFRSPNAPENDPALETQLDIANQFFGIVKPVPVNNGNYVGLDAPIDVRIKAKVPAEQRKAPTTATKHDDNKSGQKQRDLLNRFRRQTSTTDALPARGDAAASTDGCKQIGEKCYRHDECCTKLCHGFLHQCVT